MGNDTGYSLVEVLVATGIMLSVVAGALLMVGGAQASLGTEGERVDQQQRVRVAFDALSRDLIRAGTGASHGRGSASFRFPAAALFPFRQGALGPDPPGAFRPDVLTAVYVLSETSAQTTLAQPLPARSGIATINLDPGCPAGDAACGFGTGDDLMVFDDTGAFDTFRVTDTTGGALALQHTMPDTTQTYPAGASLAEAVSRSYYLRSDAATDTLQLVRYDGVASDAAVVDHVVSLRFQYFGEPSPPTLIRSVTDPVGPWTTYGPKPPPPGVQTTGYPAGENCAFQLDGSGSQQVSRLLSLGSGATTLVSLTAAGLQDGPWCPDAVNAHRYDADLLRVRRVSVVVRIEAALAALRGPAGVLFARAGTGRVASRWVPDQEIRFDVAPRNLNFGR